MAILKLGSAGEEVKKLQRLLNAELKDVKLTEDGDFGAKTDTAVKKFQKMKGLKDDGVVGPQTWTALGHKIGTPPAPAGPSTPAPQPPATTPGGKTDWMDIAKAELGVHENSLPGENNKRIVEYHQATTLKATDDETPWCSSFVNWVMAKAGYTGSKSALAASWLKWGAETSNGKVGAICVIKKKNASSDKSTGSSTGYHVGFIVQETTDTVRLLGGNQSDSVKYSTFYLKSYDIKGRRWPS